MGIVAFNSGEKTENEVEILISIKGVHFDVPSS